MTVNDLIQELSKCDRDAVVGIFSASSGNPEHKKSAVFSLLSVDTAYGVNLVQSNYANGYVPVTVADRDTR